VGDVAGAIAGVGAGAATANPAVAVGVAIGVKAATDATAKYVFRNWHRAEQDSIAAIIGGTPVGTSAAWEVRHSIPYENEHGAVQVVRVIASALTECREALFSVAKENGGPDEVQWFQVLACRQGPDWKWASAEPAVSRWGNLQ
jgi:hypothetical protein